MNAYRSIELLRAGWGASLLVAPEKVLRRVHGVKVDRNAVVVARTLGARHLVQAALSGVKPGPKILAVGVLVDSLHALTAFGLARVDPGRARAGVTDGVIAGVWAGLGAHDLQTAVSRRRYPSPPRHRHVHSGKTPSGR